MRRIGWWLVALSAWGVVAYAVLAYSLQAPGSTVHPTMMAVYQREKVGICTHVFASALALMIGPLQFVESMRSVMPSLHRALGKSYLALGVLPGGLAGLYMAFHSFGGWIAHSGFAALALIWLWSAWMAYSAALRRDFAAHRAWMMRNFALTFAAVTLRGQLAGMASIGLRFEDFYPWLAWTSWLPNLLAAEWLVRSGPAHCRIMSGSPPTATPVSTEASSSPDELP